MGLGIVMACGNTKKEHPSRMAKQNEGATASRKQGSIRKYSPNGSARARGLGLQQRVGYRVPHARCGCGIRGNGKCILYSSLIILYIYMIPAVALAMPASHALLIRPSCLPVAFSSTKFELHSALYLVPLYTQGNY
jgi:hypothetical protein